MRVVAEREVLFALHELKRGRESIVENMNRVFLTGANHGLHESSGMVTQDAPLVVVDELAFSLNTGGELLGFDFDMVSRGRADVGQLPVELVNIGQTGYVVELFPGIVAFDYPVILGDNRRKFLEPVLRYFTHILFEQANEFRARQGRSQSHLISPPYARLMSKLSPLNLNSTASLPATERSSLVTIT